MSKRKLKFKLGEITIKGVELEIEDDLDRASAAFGALQSQLAGAVQPAISKALVAASGPILETSVNGQPTAAPTAPNAKRTRRRGVGSVSPKPTEGLSSSEESFTLIHDPEKFGNPSQSWNTLNKSIWLLWVVEQALGKKEMTAYQLTSTFNKYFREFGTIRTNNVSRDLGVSRTKSPPLVGVDPNKNPQVWFLYDAGKTYAKRLASGWDGKSE